MGEKREALTGIAVGRKGVGKTYATLEMIQPYVLGNPALGIEPRKALLLDVNNEFVDVKADQNPNFQHIKALYLEDVKKFTLSSKIEMRRIAPIRPEGGAMTTAEITEAMFHILENYQNGLLLLEDINKIVSDSISNELMGSIVTQRHKSVDIILHFQTVGKMAQPKLWGNANWIRFHACDDTIERHKNKFAGEITHLKILEKMVQIEFAKGNHRFYAFFNKDEGKIEGKFTKRQFQYAIYQYLEDEYNSVVRPLLNKKDLATGRPIYTDHKDLAVKLITEYTERFYGN